MVVLSSLPISNLGPFFTDLFGATMGSFIFIFLPKYIFEVNVNQNRYLITFTYILKSGM